MKTAIDSSVLWCLLKQQAGFKEWQQILWQAGQDGALLVCPVVIAEIAPAFGRPQTHFAVYKKSGYSKTPLNRAQGILLALSTPHTVKREAFAPNCFRIF